jgi:hypothetical protein
VQEATVEVWHEQLRVPLSWWLLGAAFVGTVVWVVWVVSPGLPALSAGAVAAVVVAVALQRWSSTVIAVESGPQHGRLVAGRARLPLSVVSAVSALSADELRRQSGVDADARAHLVLPPFVPTGVRVDLADPSDPTPYWLVATRHPDELVVALTGALTAVRD